MKEECRNCGIIKNAIDLLGSDLCKKHIEQARNEPFDVFIVKNKAIGCKRCLYEKHECPDCKRKDELIAAQKEYIALLNAELNDVSGMLYVHGFRSKRVEAGKDARTKILKIESELRGNGGD